jgi:hypothetical protein
MLKRTGQLIQEHIYFSQSLVSEVFPENEISYIGGTANPIIERLNET